jgi:hypothetical protein
MLPAALEKKDYPSFVSSFASSSGDAAIADADANAGADAYDNAGVDAYENVLVCKVSSQFTIGS